MKIVIAGSSGFIGRYLVSWFRQQGHSVSELGRSTQVTWGQTQEIAKLLEGTDLLLNLAGKSVNCRYNEANMAEILRSRVDTTAELLTAVKDCKRPPRLWINSSTATIYRHSEDLPMSEAEGELGAGFSVSVAKAWEESFFREELPNTRRVAIRSAIVLGDGGALIPMLRLAKFGLGGAQLDGRWFSGKRRRAAGVFHEFGARGGSQKFSWIHVADLARAIEFIWQHPDIDGVVNLAAPNPIDNRTLMGQIRSALGIPFGFPAFRWMTELGAIAIRTETELILKSRWVIPQRLSGAGFSFSYPTIDLALKQIIETGTNHRDQ